MQYSHHVERNLTEIECLLKHSIIPPSLTPYFFLQQAIFHSMHLNLKSQKEPGLDRTILVDTQGKLSWVNGTNGGDHHLCPRKKKKENLSCQGPVWSATFITATMVCKACQTYPKKPSNIKKNCQMFALCSSAISILSHSAPSHFAGHSQKGNLAFCLELLLSCLIDVVCFRLPPQRKTAVCLKPF